MTTPKSFSNANLMGGSVGKMPGSIYYTPLVQALAILLLLPPVSKVEAQTLPPIPITTLPPSCNPSQSQIIQNQCNTAQSNDLIQFESDMVNAWLSAHNLPATDRNIIYTYGRSDLRNERRAYMLARLIAITQTPQAQRTPHEQALYQWFADTAYPYERNMYSSALGAFQSFQNDPCHWQPDADIAKQYSLNYDALAFCYPDPLGSLFAEADFPSYAYFTAFGMLKGANSYGSAISGVKDGPAIATQTGANLTLAIAAGSALAGGVAAAIGVGAAVTIAAAAIFPASIGFLGATATVTSLTAASVAAGPAAVVLIAVVIGVVAAFEIFQQSQNNNNLNSLQAAYQYTYNLPNLTDFAQNVCDPSIPTCVDATGKGKNSSGKYTDPNGLYKLTAAFTAATLPEFSSTQALPTHQSTDDVFKITIPGVSIHQSPQLSYWDSNSTTWTASTYGGWFVQNGLTTGGTKLDSITPTINYLDWSGNQLSASRVGNNFLVIKRQPLSTDITCPADATTGVTPNILLAAVSCSSYVISTLSLIQADGTSVWVSLIPTISFTSAATANFAEGVAGTFTITTSGSPSLTESGALPNGITFTDNGGGQASLSGTAATGTAGTYPITLHASASGKTVDQSFTLSVAKGLAITSPNSATFTAGVPGSFKVTTVGATPTLSIDTGILPPGLTFKDYGDGTAIISGTASPPSPYTILGCLYIDGKPVPTCESITAMNASQTVYQPFSINVVIPTLTVASFPTGLSFASTCGSSGPFTTPKSFTPQASCNATFTSPAAGKPGTQYVFRAWADGSTSNPRTFTAPSGNIAYTADFKTQYLLTIAVQPSGAGTVTGGGWVDPGSVTLKATANSGYVFKNFTGANSSGQVDMSNGPEIVTANFEVLPRVTVNTYPAGQSFTVDGTSYTSAQVFQWVPGSAHTLAATATQPGATGVQSVWSSWSDNGTASHTVAAPAVTTTYTANFTTQYQLTTSAGTGGSISPSTEWVNAGASVPVSAMPNSGYAFTGFTGDLSGSTSPHSIAMNAAHSVGANFARVTSTTMAAASGHYGDSVGLSATVSPAGASGSLQFAVNGSAVGSPVTVNGGGPYSAPSNYAITQPQGSYSITATFTGAAGILGSTGSNNLGVSLQSATVTPASANPGAVQVSATGGTASSITLKAAIQSSLGDMTNATPVTFTLNPAVVTAPITCPVTTSVATGVLTATATCPNVPVNVYDVKVGVGGNYYTGSADSTLAVYDPSLGFVTGSGSVLDNGVPADFAISSKYPQVGGLQGGLTYIEHRTTGDVTVVSTSLSAMSVVGKTAVILGTATVNGVGTYSLQLTVTDNGQPGPNRYLLGLKLSGGALAPAISFAPVSLATGNIKINPGTGGRPVTPAVRAPVSTLPLTY